MCNVICPALVITSKRNVRMLLCFLLPVAYDVSGEVDGDELWENIGAGALTSGQIYLVEGRDLQSVTNLYLSSFTSSSPSHKFFIEYEPSTFSSGVLSLLSVLRETNLNRVRDVYKLL